MRTVLSVDWDFFVPEKIEWDVGHREALFFLKALWATRLWLYDEMKTDGREGLFWRWVSSWADLSGACLVVSDSHCFAYDVTTEAQRVILVDAHHDCWDAERPGEVACHNWARVWLEQRRNRRMVWVHPGAERIENCPLPDDLNSRVKLTTMEAGRLPKVKLGAVHICRSGCWTPPWLDEAFIRFVSEIENAIGPVMNIQTGDWNPMVKRWSDAELDGYMAQHKVIQEQIDKLRNGRAK